MTPPDAPGGPGRSAALLYASVACLSGAVIALQIAVMRVFAVGSWSHFGSTVVSLAMMGFGLASVLMCVSKGWFERHGERVASVALLAFPLLTAAANLLAQAVPFNPIFLVSDHAQAPRLAGLLALYLVPFLAGAFFLGAVFLRWRDVFARVYFADLGGAGLGGLTILAAMTVVRPEHLITIPLALGVAAAFLWFAARGSRRGLALAAAVGVVAGLVHGALPPALGLSRLRVNDYKGIAYARRFPDSRRVHESTSPFGQVEVYASSYLHFAPGLSDNAAFNLKTIPEDAYLGMYLDGDGPIGVMRVLTADESEMFRFLPVYLPYVVKDRPDTFVVQFGGGISANVALARSRHVTVAEGNPAILHAFRTDPQLRAFTGDILSRPGLTVVDQDGRLFLARTDHRYDVIDLSLADSTGLSSPGGFAIVEKYAYTEEAMRAYMRALAPGGVLAVTIWNKEEPPKSVLRLYATMAEAARGLEGGALDQRFFAVSTYLSTATVLYKRGGFTDAEVERLRAHARAMSFDEITSPGFVCDASGAPGILKAYRESIFGAAPTHPEAGAAPPAATPAGDGLDGATSPAGSPAASGDGLDGSTPSSDDGLSGASPGGAVASGGEPAAAEASDMPATTLGRIAWNALLHGGWGDVASHYVFDVRPLTNDRPYFAGYVRPRDLPRVTDRLEILQDEWGYLLLWATLLLSLIAAGVLIAFPVVFGWRTIFSRQPGQLPTLLYFACLGLGYMMTEVALIARFVMPLANATVSASILITGMLVFSGLGALASERILARARSVMPWIFVAIAAILIGYGLGIDPILDRVGSLPHLLRVAACLALVAPPAFLMGFPMPAAMTWLGRLKKEHVFLWAWGINGCASVIGSAAVPLFAVSFGLSRVLELSGLAYLVAAPAFLAVLLPLRPASRTPES